MPGGWYEYTWQSGKYPASKEGTLALGFVPANGVSDPEVRGQFKVAGVNDYTFEAIDLTETEQSSDTSCIYRGGIQSVDKGFTASPILIPLPEELQIGWDIGFVESGTITIAGVWFDGLGMVTMSTGTQGQTKQTYSRDIIIEDLRTTKSLIKEECRQSPLILLLSSRAYPVLITGYSSNIIGGQGNTISIRLGLAICQLKGHYKL